MSEIRSWAFAVDPEQIPTETAAERLQQFNDDLEVDAQLESERTMIEARVARMGEQYRAQPLTSVEMRIIRELRSTPGRSLDRFTAYLALGIVLPELKQLWNKSSLLTAGD